MLATTAARGDLPRPADQTRFSYCAAEGHHAARCRDCEHAPGLTDVLERAELEAWWHIELDGTLIPATRVRERTERGKDVWYSGKHKQHGGNLQILYDPHGFPVWVSPAEPGSTTTSPRRADTCSRS